MNEYNNHYTPFASLGHPNVVSLLISRLSVDTCM
jgi:hypothetical protein